MHGETYNCPVEVCEARYGLYVECMTLNDEPGGHGQYRGGQGIRIDYRVRSEGTFLTCGYTRSVVAPWGLEGGAEGSPNYIEVVRKDGRSERHAMASGVMLSAGDIVRVRTGAGGGYGDPALRSREAVIEDLKNGYLSTETASAVYGVRA
nr:hydantoinase B/oxoprolinase family protein [Pseudomonas aeruginosa]